MVSVFGSLRAAAGLSTSGVVKLEVDGYYGAIAASFVYTDCIF